MAQGSNSQEDKEKNEIPDEVEAPEAEAASTKEDGESSADEPAIIEGEAVEAEAEAPEADSEAVAEEAPPPPAMVPPPERSGPGAMTMILGGIVAGAIGYGASFLSSDRDTGVAETVAAVEERMETLAADVASLQDAPAPEVDVSGIEQQLGDLAARLDGINADITALQGSLEQTSAAMEADSGDLSQRIAMLEAMDLSGLPEATEDQIAAFRERLGAITEEAEAKLNAATEQAAALEAQAAARAEEMQAAAQAAAAEAEQQAARIEAEARRTAALADLNAAMENGTPFNEALESLDNAPEELVVLADKGVPTLAELQRGFPAVARAALMETSTVAEDASAGDRFAAFLKRRTGARSLTPQEGEGSDAILSRAEAALAGGDLQAAIAEVEALPEASLAVMNDWLTRARTRSSALVAVDGLTATN